MARAKRSRAFIGEPRGYSDAYVSHCVGGDDGVCWIKIADCHRSISLDFEGVGNKKQDLKKYLKFRKIMGQFFERADKVLGVTDA